MSHKTPRFLTALLLMSALAGCAHKAPLVGTWSGTTGTPQGVTLKTTWQFAEDGHSAFTLEVVSGPNAPRSVSATGTYTVNGSSLTNTIQSMSEGPRTKSVTGAKPETFQFTLNGDTLTLTEPGRPAQVLTRQSS